MQGLEGVEAGAPAPGPIRNREKGEGEGSIFRGAKQIIAFKSKIFSVICSKLIYEQNVATSGMRCF